MITEKSSGIASITKDTMKDKGFNFSQTALDDIAARVLELAVAEGSSASEVDVSESLGQTVSVRLSEVETIEYNQDKSVGVTAYLGHKAGHARTSDFSEEALARTVRAALDIARYTAEDPYSGLPDPSLMARTFPNLSLYHPWALPVPEAIGLAQSCEATAMAADQRIHNSEGSSVSSQSSHFVYANSHGFSGGYASSRHSISVAVVADNGTGMQRDFWYSSARCPEDLDTPSAIGAKAGQRAARRLGARKIKTGQYPVIFEAPISGSLLSHFVAAISGSCLYRKSSFLLDSLGKSVMSENITIDEDPFVLRGMNSAAFDNEGVATMRRRLVDKGVLQGYILGIYAARKLGMQTTGNAGGAHNLIVHSTGESLEELLQAMGTGLLVTELLGQGVNTVTGDYSRGAAGFWVERGVIAHPVEEVTIAGNLKQMFLNIDAVSNDVLERGGRKIGSVLVRSMMLAGED